VEKKKKKVTTFRVGPKDRARTYLHSNNRRPKDTYITSFPPFWLRLREIWCLLYYTSYSHTDLIWSSESISSLPSLSNILGDELEVYSPQWIQKSVKERREMHNNHSYLGLFEVPFIFLVRICSKFFRSIDFDRNVCWSLSIGREILALILERPRWAPRTPLDDLCAFFGNCARERSPPLVVSVWMASPEPRIIFLAFKVARSELVYTKERDTMNKPQRSPSGGS